MTYNEDKKKEIVVELASRNTNAASIAKKHNIRRETIYLWQKDLAGGPIMKKENQTKEELVSEIERLKKEQKALEMENQILKKANELLKKEIGANFENLTNKEKSIIVSALKNKYKIKDLLLYVKLKKTTYFYEINRIGIDKYKDIRKLIKIIFNSNYQCYGYRRIKKALLDDYDITISEKVVKRLMFEEKLIVFKHKTKKKYSSYEGEISPEVPNVINRDFKADKPHVKALTDITEFSLCDGKVYLSPIIDCYDGLPITWTIGKSPNSMLTNTMLDQTYEIVGDKQMIIHSDRGLHYRIESWIKRMENFGYQRSMSKKGCSPDNSMGEGFFGTIKNEFFYSKNWTNVKCDDFIVELSEYLTWFKTKRIKLRLL